jgi:hypothetical protein
MEGHESCRRRNHSLSQVAFETAYPALMRLPRDEEGGQENEARLALML